MEIEIAAQSRRVGAPADAPASTVISSGAARLVPWSSRRRRFEANLAVLAQRWPEAVSELARPWPEAAARHELHISADGAAQVFVRAVDGNASWLCGRKDHRAAARQEVRLRSEGVLPPSVLIDGVGMGWHVVEVYRQTDRTFLDASGALYVVEREPEVLAMILHIHDWRGFLLDPRVCLFVGPQALAALEAHLDDSRWPLPTIVCRSPGLRPQPPALEAIHRVVDRRIAQVERLSADVRRRYAGRDAAWWARRFGAAVQRAGESASVQRAGESASVAEPPLRVLCVTSRHTTFLQYSMRDCVAALESLGCEARLLMEATNYQRLDPTLLLREQRDFEPDLILLLSRMRYEVSEQLLDVIPSVTWDQDSLPWVFREEFRDRFGPNDFLLGIKALDAPYLYGWPAARCRYCDLAASERTYSAEPLPEADLAPYRCDASYVSHASRPPEEEHRHVLTWLESEHLRGVYEAVVERLLPAWRAGPDFPGPLHSAIYDAFEQRLQRPPTADEFAAVHQAAMRLADRAVRHSALEWVADWAERHGRRLHIYGNGWERHPRFGGFARGPAANGAELRRVYQASAINLQLMSWGFLHQRALDGLCAGGFFLSRRSLWDEWTALLRRLDDRLRRAGAADPAGFEQLPESDRKADVRAALADLGADARWLASPYAAAALREARQRSCTVDVFAAYPRISFDSPRSFEVLAERFLAAPAERVETARELRAAVIERYTYERRMRQMLELVRDGYTAAAPSGATPRP